MKLIRQLAVIGLALQAQSTQPVQYRSCVLDEAITNQGVADLRRRLLLAIGARNVSALQPLVDPGVRYDFGEQGWEGFSRAYQLASSESPMWTQLESDLSHGGKFVGDDFCAPYFMCPTWPGVGDESVLVVLHEGVPIREQALATAASIGTTMCQVITVPAQASWPHVATGWTPVWLSSERWGFVEATHVVMAQTSVRLGRRGGQWRLVSVLGID